MIFRFIEIKNMAEDARKDPKNFAKNTAEDYIKGIIASPVISYLVLMIVFFVFGFTGFLGGPYGLFRFFFVLFLIPAVFLFFFLRKIFTVWREVKNSGGKVKKEPIEVESKVID